MRTSGLYFICFAVLSGCAQSQPSTQPKIETQEDPRSDFVSIFDGKSLDGWGTKKASRKDDWSVEGGLLVGENPSKKGSNLWTEKKYVDFDLVLKYKSATSPYDSGVWLRGSSHQVQIGISGSFKIDLTGCIYPDGEPFRPRP